MSQPFVFMGTFRLKDGKLASFREMCRQLVALVESQEPRIIAFNLFASEDGTEASTVQVHRDAESMLFHLEVLKEHVGSGDHESPVDVAVSNQIYGEPTEALLETIKQIDPGVPLIVKPLALGGFVRAGAAR